MFFHSIHTILNKIRFFNRNVTIGLGTKVPWRTKICSNGGNISIGRNCEFHDYSMVLSYGGSIEIGNNCSINPFAVLYGHGGLKIGNGVRIASQVILIPANHLPGDDESPLYKQGISTKGIEISDNCWLGAGSKVLDGVKIGKNSIIGAGSVVTRDVPENSTVIGVPARIQGA